MENNTPRDDKTQQFSLPVISRQTTLGLKWIDKQPEKQQNDVQDFSFVSSKSEKEGDRDSMEEEKYGPKNEQNLNTLASSQNMTGFITASASPFNASTPQIFSLKGPMTSIGSFNGNKANSGQNQKELSDLNSSRPLESENNDHGLVLPDIFPESPT